MKDFNDFLEYYKNNIPEIMYDTFNEINDISNTSFSLNDDEVKILVKTMINTNLALLRQYHNWLNRSSRT